MDMSLCEKKRRHVLTEQQGRQKINLELENLKQLLPECRYVPTTKLSILSCAVSSLKKLNAMCAQLLVSNKQLQKENKRLQFELEQYKRLNLGGNNGIPSLNGTNSSNGSDSFSASSSSSFKGEVHHQQVEHWAAEMPFLTSVGPGGNQSSTNGNNGINNQGGCCPNGGGDSLLMNDELWGESCNFFEENSNNNNNNNLNGNTLSPPQQKRRLLGTNVNKSPL